MSFGLDVFVAPYGAGTPSHGRPTLEVAQPSRLVLADGVPRIVARDLPSEATELARLYPSRGVNGSSLAVRSTSEVRRNGVACAGALCLLDAGDMMWTRGWGFLVRANPSEVLVAGAAHRGAICPVCRSPVEDRDVVHRCACTALLHVASAGADPEATLDCVRHVAACPRCGRAVDAAGSTRP